MCVLAIEDVCANKSCLEKLFTANLFVVEKSLKVCVGVSFFTVAFVCRVLLYAEFCLGNMIRFNEQRPLERLRVQQKGCTFVYGYVRVEIKSRHVG